MKRFMRITGMNVTADFETNNCSEDCRVWSWGINDINNSSIYLSGTSISEFIETIKEMSYAEPLKIWFHNLKFDGSFIVNFLFQHEYTYTNNRKALKPNMFTTLISDMGQWYSINICFGNSKNTGNVIIQDSAKVLPFSVAEVALSFGLEESKGSIDYDAVRPIGYIPTEEEKEYQRNDCLIMAKVLNRMAYEGMHRMTAGSNALHHYKSLIDKRQWEKWFPQIDCDEYVRKSYRGGWVYADPRYKGKPTGPGIVLDVNSLYPSRMRFELFPYGQPTFFDGKYKPNKGHPLYIQHIKCAFEIKPKHLPTIQIKNSSRFFESEYVTSSHGEIVELYLTNVDLALFLEHYDVRRIEYIDGVMFKGQRGMFDEYIDYWMKRKIEAEQRGDKAGRTLAKLYLNSLYGKFAKRPKGKSKIPYLDNGILKFYLGEEEKQGALYIPVGTFVTAYARNYTIRSAQKEYERFIYADTDSLHLSGTDMPTNISISKTELGKWKHESTFKKALYIGAKCYIEEEIHSEEEIEKYLDKKPDNIGLVDKEAGTILKITCAGLPEKLHNKIKFEDFKVGMKIEGKLMPKQVVGGVILEKTTFEIKDRKF